MSARTIAHVVFRHWRRMLAILAMALALGGGWVMLHPPRWRAEASLAVDDPQPGAVAAVVALVRSRDLQREAVERYGARLLPAVPPGERPDAFAQLLDARGEAGVVRVRLDGPDPEAAVQALAAVVVAVQAANRGVFASGDAQQAGLQEEANRAQERLAAFRRGLGGDPAAERAQLATRRTALENELTAAEADAAALADKASQLEGQLAHTPATVELARESERPRVLDEARSKLFQLETQEQELLGKYQPNSPLVLAVEEEMRRVEKMVREYRAPEQDRVSSGANPLHQALEQDLARAQAGLASAKARARTLAHQQSDLDRRLAEFSQAEAQAGGLEAAAHDAQARLEAAGGRHPAATGIGIVEKARADARPVGPPPLLILAVAGAAGLVVATLVAALAQRFGARLDTPGAVERRLGLAVLTSIPHEG